MTESRLRLGSGAHSSVMDALLRLTTIGLFTTLAACGGGGGDGGGGIGGIPGGGGGWTPGVFLPAAQFQGLCASPRSGNDPSGNPWPDRQGTRTDENNFLRSYSDDTYLWYGEITDRDPALFDTPTYFDGLRTFDTTPSGTPKDQFHFTYDTDEWIALSQSGVSGGYGTQFAVLEPTPPRRIVVAYTDPNTPAATANLLRGAEIITIDGVDVANGNDVDTLNNGLFPQPGEQHTFVVRDLGAVNTRPITMTAGLYASTPVQNVGSIPTATGNVGYLLFNDHIATAEQQLVDAVNQLNALNIVDLVIDLRYNGGGFLDIASEFAYMIAGAGNTGGRIFEQQQFNDKHPSTNPVTGQPLTPLQFHSTAPGFFTIPAGTPLPSLNLSRVYVLTGSGTCSASEAIMNGLRGANVEVIQIGSRTCGKPYGFYPTDNCGTTYFTIQFRGVNDANFGDYADGFTPQNSLSSIGTPVPGCNVGDDFSAALGDVTEARLAAALAYRETGTCPAPAAVAPPGLSKLMLDAEERIVLPKSPWRQNRIMQR